MIFVHNFASGVDDDMTSPDARQAGDADNTDDDGGFRDHRRGSHRTNPVMATATYHQPRGANQANIVDEPGNVFAVKYGSLVPAPPFRARYTSF